MRTLMDKPDHALNDSVKGLMSWLFCEPNPIALNTALMMTKAVDANFRLPYQALNLQQREEGLALLKAIDSSELVGDSLSLMADEDFTYSA